MCYINSCCTVLFRKWEICSLNADNNSLNYIFCSQLVESSDVEPDDTEGQLFHFIFDGQGTVLWTGSQFLGVNCRDQNKYEEHTYWDRWWLVYRDSVVVVAAVMVLSSVWIQEWSPFRKLRWGIQVFPINNFNVIVLTSESN